MNKRATELAELGRRAYDTAKTDDPFESLIEAVAVMLAAPKERAAAKETKPLPFAPGEFYSELKKRASHIVLCEPVESRLFGRLGRVLQQTSGLEPTDKDLIIDWIEAGGLKGWPGGQPTFEHCVKHFGKWMQYAREWDKRGRQPLGGGRMSTLPVEGDFR